jgi:hypothetical protein
MPPAAPASARVAVRSSEYTPHGVSRSLPALYRVFGPIAIFALIFGLRSNFRISRGFLPSGCQRKTSK